MSAPAEPARLDDANNIAVDELDPRRWITLIILLATVVLVAIDMSVLNVSIPTILHELDTTVPALEWVITGYSLTFATLLIIGGRLGDIYGHRRMFIIGAALFGTGSLIASISQNVGMLIVGEAVVEGIGASLMAPATLALLSSTFRGRERATAFAAWGACSGAAVAFGPVLGGFLTTNYSWRWSFRINVIVAPIAVIAAVLVMKRSQRAVVRTPIDIPGAAMIAIGMFLLVFSLSEGGVYGWIAATQGFSIAGVTLWPGSMPVSIAVVAFLLSLVILACFTVYERRKEREGRHPLLELSQFSHPSFRYGLITTTILALGQLGFLFALPLFLQNAKHLTAEENGWWMLPLGVFVVAGAQIGGRVTRRVGVTNVVRAGLWIEVVGLVFVVVNISPDITFLGLLPGLALFGVGVGFASAQLMNVVLSEIVPEKSGVASGANSTARQVGGALGAAIMGTLITVLTISHATAATEATALPAPVKAQAIDGIQAEGPSYTPAPNVSSAAETTLEGALSTGLADGTRVALLFTTVVVAVGALASFLIPQISPTKESVAEEIVDANEDFEPIDLDPALLTGVRGATRD